MFVLFLLYFFIVYAYCRVDGLLLLFLVSYKIIIVNYTVSLTTGRHGVRVIFMCYWT